MSACICTMGIAASGTLTGTGPTTTTIFTVTNDGFYLFAGLSGTASSTFSVQGQANSINMVNPFQALPMQYSYITSGNMISIVVTASNSWSVPYVIYSL